jgi:hypothetical protein
MISIIVKNSNPNKNIEREKIKKLKTKNKTLNTGFDDNITANVLEKPKKTKRKKKKFNQNILLLKYIFLVY